MVDKVDDDDVSLEEVLENDEVEEKDDDTPADRGDDLDDEKGGDPKTESDSEQPDDADPADDSDDESSAEKEKDDTKDQRIPYERFKEVIDKSKAFETELNRLKEQLAKKDEDQGETAEDAISALEAEFQEAIDQADYNKAFTIKDQINDIKLEIATEKAIKTAEQGDAKSKDDLRWNAIAVEAETKFPQLSDKSESYDPQLVGDVLELEAAFVNSGAVATRSEALQKALAILTKVLDAPKETKKPSLAKEVKQGATKKADPPNLDKAVGTNDQKSLRDYATISDDDFDKLPDAEKKAARGDTIEEMQ